MGWNSLAGSACDFIHPTLDDWSDLVSSPAQIKTPAGVAGVLCAWLSTGCARMIIALSEKRLLLRFMLWVMHLKGWRVLARQNANERVIAVFLPHIVTCARGPNLFEFSP